MKTSKASIGTGKTKGTKCLMTSNKTHPAKIFPNRRKENEIKRAISEKSSITPVKNPKTELRLTNFPLYFKKPIVVIPKISITRKEMVANAKVTLASVFIERNNPVNSPDSL